MSQQKELAKTGLLTRSQFQKFTGFKSRQAIYNRIHDGRFPPGHLLAGNLRVWRAEDIHEWIEQNFPRQNWKHQ